MAEKLRQDDYVHRIDEESLTGQVCWGMKTPEQIERDLRNGIGLPNQREYTDKAERCGATTGAIVRTLGELERLLT